jgi:hypothetical protein
MKIKLLSALFVLFTAISFTSCDTEPIDQNIVSQDPGDDDGGDDDGGDDGGDDNGGGGSATGDYWPMALNNQWQFESDEPQNDEPMKIVETETIDGTLYYKVNYAFANSGTDDLTGTAVIYLRKQGAEYYQRVQVNVPEQEGLNVTVSPYELLILKDLEPGQSWTDSTTQITSYQSTDPELPIDIPDSEATIDITGTVLEKDITVNVNGATYSHVIKVKCIQDVTIHLGGGAPDLTTSTVTFMWFCKGVGPIKSESTYEGETHVTQLVSYIVN